MAATTSAIPAFKPTYLGAGDLPWHPFTPYSEEVMLKILHLDLVRGEVVLMLKAPGGTNLGVHNHYGRVLVYTVQGTWSYAEHDWSSSAGDFVLLRYDLSGNLDSGFGISGRAVTNFGSGSDAARGPRRRRTGTGRRTLSASG